ncbi:MAG TPA: hypothetical protein PKW15_03695 [Alphaproteobacteria bacterium]|nr:hypothetical protein [Rhodospirillaceae bacterium]HRJ12330.1 hypothetical protein [Alphaproteobacteria bacterium]
MVTAAVTASIDEILTHVSDAGAALDARAEALAVQIDRLHSAQENAAAARRAELGQVQKAITLREMAQQKNKIPDYVLHGDDATLEFYAAAQTLQGLKRRDRKKIIATTLKRIDDETKAFEDSIVRNKIVYSADLQNARAAGLLEAMTHQKIIYQGPGADQNKNKNISTAMMVGGAALALGATATTGPIAAAITLGLTLSIAGGAAGLHAESSRDIEDGCGATVICLLFGGALGVFLGFFAVPTALPALSMGMGAAAITSLIKGIGMRSTVNKAESFLEPRLSANIAWDAVPGSFSKYNSNLEALAERVAAAKVLDGKTDSLPELKLRLDALAAAHEAAQQTESAEMRRLHTDQESLCLAKVNYGILSPKITDTLKSVDGNRVTLPVNWRAMTLSELLPVLQGSITQNTLITARQVINGAAHELQQHLGTSGIPPQSPPPPDQHRRLGL